MVAPRGIDSASWRLKKGPIGPTVSAASIIAGVRLAKVLDSSQVELDSKLEPDFFGECKISNATASQSAVTSLS